MRFQSTRKANDPLYVDLNLHLTVDVNPAKWESVPQINFNWFYQNSFFEYMLPNINTNPKAMTELNGITQIAGPDLSLSVLQLVKRAAGYVLRQTEKIELGSYTFEVEYGDKLLPENTGKVYFVLNMLDFCADATIELVYAPPILYYESRTSPVVSQLQF